MTHETGTHDETRAAEAPPPVRVRFGLRGRLFTAFGAVAALTVGASGVGLLSYARIDRAVAVIERDSLPAMDLSLQLSKEASSITAAGPRLLNAGSAEEASATDGALQEQYEVMAKAIAGIAKTSPETATKIDAIGQRLQAGLQQLAGAVQQRFLLESEHDRMVAGTVGAHRALVEAMAPLVDDAAFNLQIGLGAATESKDLARIEARLNEIAEGDASSFEALMDLRAEANLILGILSQAATAPASEDLRPLKDQFGAAADRAARALKELPKFPQLAALTAKLTHYGTSKRSLFDVRREQLEYIASGQKLAVDTAALAEQLNGEVAGFVAAAAKLSENAVGETGQAIAFGRTQLALLAGGSLLAALLIAWLYVGRSVVRRLHDLRTSMLAIAGGDLHAAIPAGGHDEIAEMAGTVRVFRDNAAAAHEADMRVAREREEMAAQRRADLLALAQGFETSVKGLVERLSAAAGQMRAAAAGMVDTAEEANRQAGAISEASTQASGNVQTVASAAEELSASIGEIGRQVTQSTQIAQAAVTRAEDTNAVVEGLAAAVQKIGDVATLITAIAGQTNLLALNATIEAARAGEAGKGFAVVAGEVKNLATQTAKATDEISAQINDICQRTAQVVEAIRSIGGTIVEISQISSAIAAAVEEQDATTREIARNIQETATVTSGVSARIVEVTAAAERTGASASEVLGSAGALAEQSGALSGEVEEFLARVRAA
jgi:methyl-accepting chemotaxis protein